MELKEFVKTTLVQIEQGVKEAGGMFSVEGGDVEFDVAVIVTSEGTAPLFPYRLRVNSSKNKPANSTQF